MTKPITIRLHIPLFILSVFTMTASGCGQSTAAGDALDEMLLANVEQDCEKLASFVDLEASSELIGTEVTREDVIENCDIKNSQIPLVDYKIVDYDVMGDHARAAVQVISIVDGEEITGEKTFEMIEKNGEWKVVSDLSALSQDEE